MYKNITIVKCDNCGEDIAEDEYYYKVDGQTNRKYENLHVGGIPFYPHIPNNHFCCYGCLSEWAAKKNEELNNWLVRLNSQEGKKTCSYCKKQSAATKIYNGSHRNFIVCIPCFEELEGRS